MNRWFEFLEFHKTERESRVGVLKVKFFGKLIVKCSVVFSEKNNSYYVTFPSVSKQVEGEWFRVSQVEFESKEDRELFQSEAIRYIHKLLGAPVEPLAAPAMPVMDKQIRMEQSAFDAMGRY